MPELPEVEATRRELLPAMEAARFERVALHRADLRTRFPRRFRARLEGCRVTGVTRRAKYLLAHLSSGETLLMHLGMSGLFRVEYGGNGSEPRPTRAATTMSSSRCRRTRRCSSTIRGASG